MPAIQQTPAHINSIKLKAIQISLGVGAVITIIKFVAYFLTHSTAIMTDALESIVNVIASIFALFSLRFAAKSRDEDHPYGHGKIEYISAGFEGGLITIAGLLICYEAIHNIINKHQVMALDSGIYLTIVSGAIVLVLGWYVQRIGKKYNSLTLKAEGAHFYSDAITSAGIIIGLVLIQLTGNFWIDSYLAIIYSAYIIYTGYKLIIESINGLLDRIDFVMMEQIIAVLNENRSIHWIDIHNMRLQKFGDSLHVDCHVTLPYYNDLQQTHEEMEKIDELLNLHFENKVEFFIHPDPCKTSSCSICLLSNCPVRTNPFQQKIDWNLENILRNKAHQID